MKNLWQTNKILHGGICRRVVFGFDDKNQPTVEYEISKLCQSPDFINAIVEVTRTRENLYRMAQILSQKLERMRNMLNTETND